MISGAPFFCKRAYWSIGQGPVFVGLDEEHRSDENKRSTDKKRIKGMSQSHGILLAVYHSILCPKCVFGKGLSILRCGKSQEFHQTGGCNPLKIIGILFLF